MVVVGGVAGIWSMTHRPTPASNAAGASMTTTNSNKNSRRSARPTTAKARRESAAKTIQATTTPHAVAVVHWVGPTPALGE